MAMTGWKASNVWTVPLKLIDRGSMPCFVAAWAMICADEIVGQNVRPDFLSNQFGRFAAQDIHLQRSLQ